MIDERLVFERFHEALDVPPPSGGFDRLRIALAAAELNPRRSLWITPRLVRATQLVLVVLVLLALAVAMIGILVAGHPPPIRPHGGQVMIPAKMVSPTIGWAQAGLSEVWRTSDSGASWTEVTPPSLHDRLWPSQYDAAFFLDGTHAWTVETGQGGSNPSNLYLSVFGTSDGGGHWHQGQSIPIGVQGGLDPVLSFIDSSHGWLLVSETNPEDIEAAPILYSTSDGGRSWKQVSAPASPPRSFCGPVPMTFVTVNFGVRVPGCGSSVVLVTRDGGISWQVQRPLPATAPDGDFDAPVLFDSMHGLIVFHGIQEVVLVTSDGGLSWATRSLPETDPMAVSFVDALHGWAATTALYPVINGSRSRVSAGGRLYHTDDGGLTWALVQTNLLEKSEGDDLGGLYFVDPKHGFASFTNPSSGTSSSWLKTSDGGRTWIVVAAGTICLVAC